MACLIQLTGLLPVCSVLTPHLTASASRPTGATLRRIPWVLRKYTTQPLGKSRGKCRLSFRFVPIDPLLHSALTRTTTLEQSELDHDDFPTSPICFSPDGRYLATGGINGKIGVRGSPCHLLKNHLPLHLRPLIPPYSRNTRSSTDYLFPHRHIYHAQPAYPTPPSDMEHCDRAHPLHI
jgi:hypothetical protein